jgi:hypothetical protein
MREISIKDAQAFLLKKMTWTKKWKRKEIVGKSL